MTVETISRDGVEYRLMIGFGRKQRARYLLYNLLPDSLKRIQAAGGEVEESDLKKLTADEVLKYNSELDPELAKLVLESASDWDKTKQNVGEYVDFTLVESAGRDISAWVKKQCADELDGKKKAPS